MSRRTMIVLVVSILVIANAGVALGKGPESVTLTGPGIDSPVELMDAVDWPISCNDSCPPDPMVRLMQQSGLWYATGDLPIAIDEPEGDLGPRHVLTWIRGGFDGESVEDRTIHQFIYLEAAGGPAIHTPASQAGLQGWGGVEEWYRAPDGLADTLSELRALLLETEGAGSVAIGRADGLVLPAMVGGALILVLVWAKRRRVATTPVDRASEAHPAMARDREGTAPHG